MNFDFWSFNFFFLHSRPFTEMRNVCFSLGFPSIFAYGPSVFVLLFWPFFLFKVYVLGLQNGPKSIPKSLRNRVPILTRLRVQICLVLGALWAPQNRPKIASRTLWAHLAVLKLHLGASRSPHAHFGSSWAHLDPPRGTILAPFWCLMGQFGPHQGSVWHHGRGIFEAFSCR